MCRCRQETSGNLQEGPDGRWQEGIKKIFLSVFLSYGEKVSLVSEGVVFSVVEV